MIGDQAEALRREVARARSGPRGRLLAVVSGKGGVGKTNLSVNLSLALLSQGERVLLMDADLGLANADIVLGCLPSRHLGHLRHGGCRLADLVTRTPSGLDLLAGGSALPDLADLPRAELDLLVSGLLELEHTYDRIVVDTGAGIGRAVAGFALAAETVLLVTTPEPTALTDAYATAKLLLRERGELDLRPVINRVQRAEEGRRVGEHLLEVVERFLGRRLPSPLYLPEDRAVAEAVRRQVPFLLGSPGAVASRAVREMAARLAGQPPAAERRGMAALLQNLWQGGRG